VIRTIVAVNAAFVLLSVATAAHAIDYVVGAPQNRTNDVEDIFEIKHRGVVIPEVKVKVEAGDSAEVKAENLKNAIITATGVLDVEVEGRTVKLGKDYAYIKPIKNFSGEADKAQPSPGEKGVKAQIDYHFDPSGLDRDGGASLFESSFGFESPIFGTVFADASLHFSDLLAATVQSLLTQTFQALLGDLPAPLHSNLTLDLANELMTFDLPSLNTGSFVANSSTDTVTQATLGFEVTQVPEPGTVVAVALGLIAGSLYVTRRRASE
jgi:hypothetical protein